MKRITLTSLLAAVAIIGLLAVAATQASADWPTSVTLTLPGGATNVVSSQYSAGIGQAVYTSFRPLSIEINLDSATTNTATFSLRKAASGPVYKTATVASNATSSVTFETNEWYVLRDEYFHGTLSLTNSGTVTITGKEQ